MDEDFLSRKLELRKVADAFRKLKVSEGKIDFCSNDYLGIATNGLLENDPSMIDRRSGKWHGSSGSRLLSGNYELIGSLENELASFHDAAAGLIFNSGYDANIGLLSCVPQRGDTILYDYLCHASLRDGMRLSLADAHSFLHNDLTDLEAKLVRAKGKVFVVTESVFSMDGDLAPLVSIAELCEKFHAGLIVDEAHATGVIGQRGEGLVQLLNLQNRCFARMHTFGKALGSHGAIVLGSPVLKDYLINFSRPFIFTTALPASAVAATGTAYALMKEMISERAHLRALASMFKQVPERIDIIESDSPIQAIIIPGNYYVKKMAERLQANNLDVRPILYPTVPEGKERLRIVLHAYNTVDEVERLVKLL